MAKKQPVVTLQAIYKKCIGMKLRDVLRFSVYKTTRPELAAANRSINQTRRHEKKIGHVILVDDSAALDNISLISATCIKTD